MTPGKISWLFAIKNGPVTVKEFSAEANMNDDLLACLREGLIRRTSIYELTDKGKAALRDAR